MPDMNKMERLMQASTHVSVILEACKESDPLEQDGLKAAESQRRALEQAIAKESAS